MTRSRAAAAVEVAGVAPSSVLQRQCGCGRGADISGTCHDCDTAARLGSPSRLVVGRPDDALEHEADRVATAVTGHEPVRRVPAPGDEGERRVGQDFADDLDHETGGGAPLSERSLTFYREQLGHDLADVRVHDSPRSVALSRQIGARAFTHGKHIFFNAGELDERSRSGQHLLAHELTHTVQQTDALARSVIQRQPDEEMPPQPDDQAQVFVSMVVSSERSAPRKTVGVVDGAAEIDQPVFPGDLLLLRTSAGVDSEWQLPEGELEFVRRVTDKTVTARVIGPSPGPGQTRSVEAQLERPDGQGHIDVGFTIGALPDDVEVVDPELEAADALTTDLVGQRRDLRREFRSQSRADRKAGRSEFRSKRKALGRDIRQARAAERRLRRGSKCALRHQRAIQEALEVAEQRAAQAIAGLSAADPSPVVVAALDDYFRVDASDDPDRAEQTITNIVDVLNLARNAMLLAGHGNFRCAASCDELTGAAANTNQRGPDGESGDGFEVTVCPIWIHDRARYGVAGPGQGGQSYGLLHEFVHIAGPSAEPEKYTHDDDWAKLGPDEARNMADAYASFAWVVSRGAAADPGGAP